MKLSIFQLISTSILSAVLSSPTIAQSPSDQMDAANRINAANARLREGKVEEALAEYREVNPTEANRDQLHYNMAVAHFLAGDTEAARELFSQASGSSDSALAASSRYNLGNCFYSDAVKTAQADKDAAIDSLQKAISHYRGSLAGNPNNVDARANIELASEFLKKLQEEKQREQNQQQQDQQQQDQQQQDQQQQDQQQQDQQQQDQQQDAQGSDSKQSESTSEQSQQPDQQKEPGEQGQSERSDASEQENQPSESKPNDSQSDRGQDTQADSQSSSNNEAKQEELNSPTSQSGEPMSQTEPRADRKTPSGAEDAMQPENAQGEQEGDDTEQALPAGELTAASEQDAEEETTGRVAVMDPGQDDGLMTKEEALKMLQAVRDRDMLRRLRNEQIERSRHVPVERDW